MPLNEHLPEHYTGKALEVHCTVEARDDEDAQALWRRTKERFLHVQQWKTYSEGVTSFEVVDQQNNVVHRPVQQGDYLRIDIPGPSAEEGEGYDWVQIQKVVEEGNEKETEQFLLMQAKPAAHPTNDKEETAHFFNDKATSNFIAERKGRTVTARIIGRNEELNTEDNSLLSKLRNFFTGGGAKAGLSEKQWQDLVDGIMQAE